MMSKVCEHQIIEDNLSVAWAKAFLTVFDHGEVSPMTVTITGFDKGYPIEDGRIRKTLDQNLKSHDLPSCETVAGTIFPKSLWNPRRNRKYLFDRYHKILPHIRKCPLNRNGIYFERLINYKPHGQEESEQDVVEGINQLDYIIETYKKENHRRSALQASIFNPACDATDQRQRGFPCLQQVGFFPNAKTKSITVSGYYPMEYIYNRGYGNYLGLCRLGKFIAHEIGFEIAEMTCFIGVGKPGTKQKRELRPLAENVRKALESEFR